MSEKQQQPETFTVMNDRLYTKLLVSKDIKIVSEHKLLNGDTASEISTVQRLTDKEKTLERRSTLSNC